MAVHTCVQHRLQSVSHDWHSSDDLGHCAYMCDLDHPCSWVQQTIETSATNKRLKRRWCPWWRFKFRLLRGRNFGFDWEISPLVNIEQLTIPMEPAIWIVWNQIFVCETKHEEDYLKSAKIGINEAYIIGGGISTTTRKQKPKYDKDEPWRLVRKRAKCRSVSTVNVRFWKHQPPLRECS